MSKPDGRETFQLASTIVNRQIIDEIHGSLVGVVQDIYVDNHLSQVTAFFIGYDGAYERNAGIVERRDVTSFGQDAILVRHSHVAVIANNPIQFPRLAAWVRREELTGQEVGTLEGERLGNVRDLVLDREELKLLGIMVEHPAAGNHDARQTIPIGALRALTYDNRIIVDLDAAQQKPMVSGERP